MGKIVTQFTINAPAEVCFDLARSIDLHEHSTRHTGEKAVAGITSGLIGIGQSVTWRAKHFGVWQRLTSRITAMERPHRFTDEMVKGAFSFFHHEHLFQETTEGTLMTDTFVYGAPMGILGRIFDRLVLETYMHKLLWERNRVIKEVAESDQRLKYLGD